jgi:archaemetzincin
MTLPRFLNFGILICLLLSGCVQKAEQQVVTEPATENKPVLIAPEKLQKQMAAVEKFFEPMGEPGWMDWLAHYDEAGQTFEQYINSNPTLPTEDRKILYIQPLGKFTPEQEKVLRLTAEFMAAFYSLPVRSLPRKDFDEPLSLENYRIHPTWKMKQVRTGYILDKVLLPTLPDDAAALIGFTAEDLYPGESMNFVFGQASLQQRVGVWSLYRMKEGKASFETFLTRTLKIAVHETGHMFSIAHCTKYKCVMSGSNGTFETDPRPLDVCPECMAKIAWGMKYGPAERYRKLADFSRRNGLTAEAQKFDAKFLALVSPA